MTMRPNHCAFLGYAPFGLTDSFEMLGDASFSLRVCDMASETDRTARKTDIYRLNEAKIVDDQGHIPDEQEDLTELCRATMQGSVVW